ncbi:hypothetical protein [Rhizobium sp.]
MRFRHLTVTATIVSGFLAIGGTAAFADNTATLRKALSHLPETALATADPMPIAFLDVKAMSSAEEGALSEAALRRMSFGSFLRPLEALQYGMGKDWTEKAGVPFEDISYFVGNGMPPVRLAYWGLADEKAADTLLEALTSRGFRQLQDTPRMLANGDPRAINFEARDETNPWLGTMGQTSFAMPHAETVMQATAPQDFEPVLEMKRSVADNPAIATLLEGIAKAPASRDSTLVQALVVTPLFGMSSVDPADFLQSDMTDLEATKKKLEEKMVEGSKGIPPYFAGMMVDAQQATGPALVISLAYADCASADSAVTTIQARWNKATDLNGIADISGQSVPAADKACAAVISFAAKGETNEPLRHAFSGAMTRKFNVLQIGAPE